MEGTVASPLLSPLGPILHSLPVKPGSRSPSLPAPVSCAEVTQCMGAACADVLIAWLKACRAVLLTTVINGFNLFSKRNVLSFCCQSSAPVPAPSFLPQKVPTQDLAACPLVAQAPLSPDTCLPIIMSPWEPVCCPLVARGEFLPVPTVEGYGATASWGR